LPTVSVTINGKSYRMACDEGQELHLEELAQEFNTYIDGLKGSFGDIGDQRLTVMAGVMVTDQVLELKEKVLKLEQEITELKETKMLRSREKQSGDDDLAKGIVETAEKIEKLCEKLSAES